MYNSIPKSKKQRPRREPKDPLWAFLQPLLSTYGHGWREIPGGVKRTRNETVINCPASDRWKLGVTIYVLRHHLTTEYTKYYTSNGLRSAPACLPGIDIDCHNKGNHVSAAAFADWLGDHVFKGLFHEPSTNKRGAHGYVVFDKRGLHDFEVNAYLKRLQTCCKHLLTMWLAHHPEHEVSGVEIKGTCPVVTWQRRRIVDFKAGQLMKLPRPLTPEDVDRLRNTTRIDARFIERLERLVKRHRVVSATPDGLRSAPSPEGDSSDRRAALATRSTAKPASRSTATPDLLSGDEVAKDLVWDHIPDRRNKQWPFWCEHVATHGLYPGLTIGDAARELGAWFQMIELFGQPDAAERTVELLVHFARHKHNGLISRDPAGPLVAKQIASVVGHAQKQTADSKQQFAIVRQKRATGKYCRNIMLEQVIRTAASECANNNENKKRIDWKCIISDLVLPAPIEAQINRLAESAGMRKRNGEYPLLRFARPFLLTLWGCEGNARIPRDACLEMSGINNPNVQLQYKQRLVEAGLIEPDWEKSIRRYEHAALYKLTTAAMELFRQAAQRATA
jgi:hypothetical protein